MKTNPITDQLKRLKDAGIDCSCRCPKPCMRHSDYYRAEELRRDWQAEEFPGAEGNFKGSHTDSNSSTTKNADSTHSILNPSPNPDPLEPDPSPPKDAVSGRPEGTTTNPSQPDDDVEWLLKRGASILRKIRKWALEKSKLQDSEQKLLYWTAHDLDRRKNPSPSNARRVRRIFEKAVREGFAEG